jgi:hypothetical protein
VRRTPRSPAFLAKCSALKRWSHRFYYGSIPRYPSQTAAKMAACEMELGGEVVQLHFVVVEERPHEGVGRHGEPPLVEGHEAHHVTF